MSSGAYLAALGKPVEIVCPDKPCVDITVLKVTYATHFGEDYPIAQGTEYVAVRVRFVGVGKGDTYNEFDWGLYINGNRYDQPAILVDGPSPTVNAGRVGPGKSFTGWMVWATPPQGKLVLAYEPGPTSLFAVVLRSK